MVKNVFTRDWIYASIIRAIKTIAQAFIGCTGATTVLSGTDWKVAAITALSAGALSIINSLAGLPEVDLEEATKKL